MDCHSSIGESSRPPRDGAPPLRPHPGEDLRFDAQDHDVRLGRGGAVVGGRLNPKERGEFIESGLPGVAGGDGVGRDQLLGEEPPDHRLAHDAGADERQSEISEHRPLPNRSQGLAGRPRWRHSLRSRITAVPPRTRLKTAASPSICPTPFTRLAARLSSPRLAGVGPKKMQNAAPGGQYAISPDCTTTRASGAASPCTGISKKI